MKNWKTTLAGLIPALFILAYKLFAHMPITAEDVTIAAGSAGIGAFAKDHNVTGGNVQQTLPPKQ